MAMLKYMEIAIVASLKARPKKLVELKDSIRWSTVNEDGEGIVLASIDRLTKLGYIIKLSNGDYICSVSGEKEVKKSLAAHLDLFLKIKEDFE